MKKYRNNGAIGALLDEYEKALFELKATLTDITQEELIAVVDPITDDSDCRSIQTILTHVVRSGYGYAVYIKNHLGEKTVFPERVTLPSVEAYQNELDRMFAYNENLLSGFPNSQLEEYDNSKKILTNWGQRYDADQLLEHAIVHILRHRRQIERFLIKLRA